MKTQIKQTAFLALIFFTFSCSKDDNNSKDKNANQAPFDFDIEAIADNKGLGIQINWEETTDPDGDNVTYNVMLGTEIVSENVSTLSYSFTASAYNTLQTGSIIAKDGKGQEKMIPFSVNSSSLVNIPDPNFEALLINANIDLDGQVNGQMNYERALEYTILDISGENPLVTAIFTDLTGIESFANLEYFNCSNHSITNLDLSHNLNLETLICSNTDLTSVNIDKNKKLISFTCISNNINTINFTNNIELESMSLEGTPLTNIDISTNTKLKELNFGGTNLTTIDLTNNLELKTLFIYESSFTSLDISKNILLENLSCSVNNLSSLDVSTNVNLKSLVCGQNNISTLDLSQNSLLERLFCNDNVLNTLNINNNNNQNLQSFNAKNNPSLTSICVDDVPPSQVISDNVDAGVTFTEICI